MGIVRSIQKGEQPASKFSKSAQDAAKKMKKKDKMERSQVDDEDESLPVGISAEPGFAPKGSAGRDVPPFAHFCKQLA